MKTFGFSLHFIQGDFLKKTSLMKIKVVLAHFENYVNY